MPTLKLTDALGLGLDGKLAEGAGLLTLLPAFTKLTSLPLDQVPVAEASGAKTLVCRLEREWRISPH